MRTPAHVWRYSPTETVRPWIVSVPGEDEARDFDTWQEAIEYANDPNPREVVA